MKSKFKNLLQFFRNDFSLTDFFKVYKEKCKRDWKNADWKETFLA